MCLIIFGRHIYHYYIHGPRGNDEPVGRGTTASPFRNIDIQVGLSSIILLFLMISSFIAVQSLGRSKLPELAGWTAHFEKEIIIILLLEQKPILAGQITLGLQCILCKLTWLALNCVQKCHNGKNGESGAKLPEALQKIKCDY